jgi:hypothetical protein
VGLYIQESLVPVSKKRNTDAYKVPRNLGKPPSENPKWLLPTVVSLLVLGPLWIVTYYVSQAQYPLPIGHWNVGIGFVFLMAAMALLTRWK